MVAKLTVKLTKNVLRFCVVVHRVRLRVRPEKCSLGFRHRRGNITE